MHVYYIPSFGGVAKDAGNDQDFPLCCACMEREGEGGEGGREGRKPNLVGSELEYSCNASVQLSDVGEVLYLARGAPVGQLAVEHEAPVATGRVASPRSRRAPAGEGRGLFVAVAGGAGSGGVAPAFFLVLPPPPPPPPPGPAPGVCFGLRSLLVFFWLLKIGMTAHSVERTNERTADRRKPHRDAQTSTGVSGYSFAD